MSVFFRQPEKRSITSVPWGRSMDPFLFDGTMRAMTLIPFYAAVTGIADDVASMPWHVFRDSGTGYGTQLPDPPLLVDPSGTGLGFMGWVVQAVMSMLVHGFAFGLILATGPNGWPSQIWWVQPFRVKIDETNPARPIFRIDGRIIDEGTFVYIPAAVMPGSIIGLSPIRLFQMQFTKGILAQKYAADFFDRGIMPPGVLKKTDKTLSPGEADFAKQRFKASVAGRDIFVTGSDWDWTSLKLPADDQTFLETIKATANEIAAIFRCAPEDIGGTASDSLTYATVELNELKRNRRTLMPWVRRLEDALTDLLPRPQYVKANMDALVRADLLARYQAHQIGLQAGIETNSEARALEDKPPLTPEQITQWKTLYGSAPAPTIPDGEEQQ